MNALLHTPRLAGPLAWRALCGSAVLCAALLAAFGEARAAEPAVPADLDALVTVALDRHPEVAALELDADAARARTTAAGRPMDPQWMLGVQALGAMPDSADPTMGMIGVEQMFALPPVYAAARGRAELDARWAEGERTRVAADVREALWEAAARLRAQAVQGRALDEQLAAAETALAFGRARYGAGAGATAPGSPGTSAEDAGPVPPPTVTPPRSSAGGMSGMGGAKGGMGAMPGGSKGMPPGSGGMSEMGGGASMGGMSGPTGMGGGEGLAALLRLEAEVARVRADRDALAARRAGEEIRLALIVGDEAARVVTQDPSRFLGGAEGTSGTSVQPERALAATSIEMAEADLRVARTGRLPTFMVATDLRVMPEGMVDGVDVQLGVTFPIWGGSRTRVEAALAASGAASRRSEGIGRSLADAIAAAKADESAAEARAKALSEVALPRAHAAWTATTAVWAAGGGTAADLVAAWQTEVGVTRDAAEAELAAELARARLARLEGR